MKLKKLLSMLLAIVLVLGLLPTAAFAITEDDMANAPELFLGANTVEVTTAKQQAYYKFIPPATEKYTLTSDCENDPKCYLYNSAGTQLASHDDISYGTNNNFRLEYALLGGETYYYGVYLYSSATGSFTATLEVTHDFTDWTATTPATCTEPGAEQGTCRYCSETTTREVAALGHDWVDYVENDPATCTEVGHETGHCSRCTETNTREIPALGHDWGAYTQDDAPSCTTVGHETAHCSRCTETNTREIPALGHDWGAYTQDDAPSCTTVGHETARCSRCTETDTREIPALGHNWSAAVSNSDGTHTSTCDRCHGTETEDCTYQTVTENGISKHTCTECGYAYYSEASGETLVQGWYFESADELTGWTMLDLDGDNYTWNRYTASGSPYEGSGCLQVHWNVNGADNWAISPAFDLSGYANATLSIWAKRQSTSYPDKFELYAGTSNDPAQMAKVLDETMPSTNYENFTADISAFAGESAVYIAIRHHTTDDSYYLYADQVEIFGALPGCDAHNLVYMPAASEPTCTEPAHTTPYYQCSICGKTFLDAQGTQPVLLSELAEAPALGHLWGEWTDTTPATCTAAGEQTRICDRCHETETQAVAALGHNWGEAVSNNDGTHTYTCDRCHETETEACTYENHVENGAVTRTCTECGYTFTEGLSGELPVETWDFETGVNGWSIVDADGDGNKWNWNNENLGHEGSVGMIFSSSYVDNTGITPDNWAISPAFSLEGTSAAELSLWAMNYQGWGDVIALYAGTAPDPDQMTKISADDIVAGSSYSQYTADLSAFAGEPIVYIAIRHYNCTDELHVFVDDVAITATFITECTLGTHTMTYVEAAGATCTEPGHTEYWHCSTCERNFADEQGATAVVYNDLITSPALGHNWGDPEYHNDGTHIRTCSRCNATYSEDCGHFKTVAFNVKKEVCPICGHVFSEENVGGLQTAIGWYFEEAYEVEDWTFIDANGDGFTWVWDTDPGMVAYEGVGKICSPSYDKPTQTALTPDNWAISPAFSLDIGCTNPTLSLWARGQDSNDNNEVFAVYASTTLDPNDAVKLTDDITTDNNYQNVTVDLSDFLDEETVYIAIRHYNCEDMFWLNVDNVEILGLFPYLVAVDEAIAHGTVTADKATAAENETVTLTVTPEAGYKLETLTVSDEHGDPVEVAEDNTFVMPASNVTVTATFAEETLDDGFYLIGPDWNLAAIDPANGFVPNPANANEYMLETTLAVGDKIKVVRVENNAITNWYPEGTGNEYTVDAAHADHVTIYFKTTYDSAWDAFGGYIWISRGPSFMTQDLLLSGEIGVQFFVDLSMLNETEKANAYVTFAISGKGKDSIDKSEFHPDEGRKNSKGYYGFICKVNAVQMADTITATLHYGDNRTIEKTYSVKEYVVKWDDTVANHPELLAHLTAEQIEYYTRIIHALADYGHYVQPFLATVNNFTLGNGEDQYAEMDKFYATTYNAGAIQTAASTSYSLGVARTGEADTFSDPTMSLVLDSETAIRVYFKAVGDITFTVDGNPVDSVPASNGRRMVEIKGVKFGDLGVAHTIVATCGDDTMTVTVSALSYVAPFLNAFHGNAAAENAICALFMLSPAADDN